MIRWGASTSQARLWRLHLNHKLLVEPEGEHVSEQVLRRGASEPSQSTCAKLVVQRCTARRKRCCPTQRIIMAARTFDGYASCFAKFATSHGCQTRARPPLAAVRQRAADVFCVITARTHDPRQTTSPVCRSFSTTAAGPVELAHSAVEDSRIGESRKDRHPKKKAALVVAYDGSYFVGSQYLPYAPST